jgi:hypothetical protein
VEDRTNPTAENGPTPGHHQRFLDPVSNPSGISSTGKQRFHRISTRKVDNAQSLTILTLECGRSPVAGRWVGSRVAGQCTILNDPSQGLRRGNPNIG